MFKIMKKSTYEGMVGDIKRLDELVKKLDEEVASYRVSSKDYQRNLELARKELEEVENEYETFKLNTMNDEENQVIMKIKDDLTTVIPIVKWKEGIENKMMELGMLNDYPPPTPKAIQLALMISAYEAMEQIIESYSPTIHHPQED